METTRAGILEFMRTHRYAVQASVSASDAAQAAVVGFVVTADFEIFFDTVSSSRKAANLRRNPRLAFVVGGLTDGDERTVQFEGVADEPQGAELDRLKQEYFARFPDGPQRQTWAGIMYVRVKPRWLRFSDYNRTPPEIVELSFT